MNKRLLQGVAAAALTATMALSAPASAQIQSGFYFGGHLGGGEADFDGILDQSGLLDFGSLDIDGFAGGIHFGYNHIFDSSVGGLGNLLLGVEGDITFTNWSDTANVGTGLTTQGIRGVVDSIGSIRARLGITHDAWLLYFTGGIAFVDAHAKAHYSGTVDKVSLNDVGGVIGAGLEFALTEMISLRFEGLYYFFNEDETFTNPPGSVFSNAELDDIYVIRGGLSISLDQLFGRMGP